MVIGYNSVHKSPKSPPHCGGRESETIADYLAVAGVMTCGIQAIVCKGA